jgi:SAM-dependent methyltransferase
MVRNRYYAVGFNAAFPGKAAFERRLHAWELADNRGDVPKDKDRWDAQYAAGGWGFLGDIGEVAHYAVIVGYGSYLKPGGSVLDVGCGSGVLHERWVPAGYRRYVGVDISEVAVRGLQDQQHPAASFVAADAEEFETDETFDVVVFNESITYFEDPARGFEKYLGVLAPNGIVIVSCHVQSGRAQAILRDLKKHHAVLDESVVQQGDASWRCTVFQPGP